MDWRNALSVSERARWLDVANTAIAAEGLAAKLDDESRKALTQGAPGAHEVIARLGDKT